MLSILHFPLWVGLGSCDLPAEKSSNRWLIGQTANQNPKNHMVLLTFVLKMAQVKAGIRP